MQRSFEIRSKGDAIEGVAMQYNAVTTLHSGRKEMFEPGSIKTIPPVTAFLDHQPGMILAREGAGLELTDTPEALTFAMRMQEPLSDVQIRAKANIDSGLLGFASITYSDVKSRFENGVNVIEEALMPALSITPHPIYPQSMIHRSQAVIEPLDAPMRYRGGLPVYESIEGDLEIRASGIFSGLVKYGVIGILSMNPPRYQTLLPRSLAGAANVVLLAGGYDSILAAAAAGSMLFQESEEGVGFRTRGSLPRTQHLRDTVARVKGNLLTGVRVGLINKVSTTEPYKDGTLETVSKADVCDFRMVVGDSFGALRSGTRGAPRRRRRNR